MTNSDFFIKIKDQIERNLPLVAIKRPNKNKVICYLQKNNSLYSSNDYTSKGVIFSPFDTNNKNVFFPREKAKRIKTIFIPSNITSQKKITYPKEGKKEFIALVKNSLQKISNGELSKVVISRYRDIAVKHPNFVKYLYNAISEYPAAYIYLMHHPKVGVWLGVTPEKLIKRKNNIISTTAIASTLPYNKKSEINWDAKDKHEQKIVSDYILKTLHPYLSNIKISAPYKFKAGPVYHLKSTFKGILLDNISIKKLINDLSPTPALCGYPKKAAKKFILETETHNRKFYGGFIGEIKSSKKLEFYVNIRCAELSPNNIRLYLGTGIVNNSNPEKEWNETNLKSQTLLNILTPSNEFEK